VGWDSQRGGGGREDARRHHGGENIIFIRKKRGNAKRQNTTREGIKGLGREKDRSYQLLLWEDHIDKKKKTTQP